MLLIPEYMSFYHARIRRAWLIEFSSALCSGSLAWAGASSGCFGFGYAQVAERGFGLVLAAAIRLNIKCWYLARFARLASQGSLRKLRLTLLGFFVFVVHADDYRHEDRREEDVLTLDNPDLVNSLLLTLLSKT